MNEKQDRLKTSRCIYKSIFSKCDKCEDKYRDLIQTKVLLLEKAISITLKCELRVWWFEWEMSGSWVVGPQLVALVGEIMELLRGEALMEEVCRGDVWIWGFIALLHFQRPPPVSFSLSLFPPCLPPFVRPSVCLSLFFSLSPSCVGWDVMAQVSALPCLPDHCGTHSLELELFLFVIVSLNQFFLP